MYLEYICKLKIREGNCTKYAIDLYYKNSKFKLWKEPCSVFKLINNDKDLIEFFKEDNMDYIIKLIKTEILKNEQNKGISKEMKIKIKNINKQFKNIKVEI